ncbi:hypothetical protein Bca4012_000322 [Brassica carinata]|uniref:JAB1/MPN/MOV34 metalloenzyme domain-containing protein n=2 Tax=Brassica oleracea TaxID=3712 RepID=A0A0D3B029_BRAOL|nr:unnamed protein product [Brassica oleracea]
MTTQSASTIEKVVVHPLVLRNIVDNHNRIAKDSGKRVVGVLLGSISRGIVGVTNSYAGSPLSPYRRWCFMRIRVLARCMYDSNLGS